MQECGVGEAVGRVKKRGRGPGRGPGLGGCGFLHDMYKLKSGMQAP